MSKCFKDGALEVAKQFHALSYDQKVELMQGQWREAEAKLLAEIEAQRKENNGG